MAEVRLTPAELDLVVTAGDENRVELEILADGVPVDLTGAVLTAQARKAPADPQVGVSAVFEDAAPAVGQVWMLWDGEDVRSLLDGADVWRGVWDLQVQMPGRALPTTPVGGRFEARMDVTRP